MLARLASGFSTDRTPVAPVAEMCRRRYVILMTIWWITASSADLVRNENICGPHKNRRLYLELGEQGVLRADNVTLAKNLPGRETLQPYAGNSSHNRCSLELVTCPSCVISITFTSINLLHHCGDGGVTIDSPCRCDYVWISEPPYEDVSGTPFCGHYAPINYRSNTRTLSIVLLYSQPHDHAFIIEYTAERNRLILTGTNIANEMSKSMNITSSGILISPFFPSRYPRDLGMEYIISCPNEIPSCRIRILFSDFQLAAVSIIEFYDWNGQRLDVSSGARFRPPIIVSTGPSLLIRFYANGGTGLGYKAFYSFVLGHEYDTSTLPITDCGGYVENLGGAITMMDMVGEGIKTYDCVWLIRPPKSFLHMKTHIYLKVVNFAEMAGNTELIIKEGPTSALMPLEVLRHPVSQLQPPKLREHVAPVTNGFHVSLRGSFGPNSRMAIAYAAFSYIDCFTGSDFLCQNHRCILSVLNCDGFDHCGDNSDEPTTCLHDWDLGLQERKWHLNKANYYFPKMDRLPDLKTATLVFVASSLGLILLISALIILLYRVGARARQQRELQSRLRTISDLLDGGRVDENSAPDEPPVYEAPPNYDEVIKLGMESTDSGSGSRRKKSRTSRDRRRSRSIPSSRCSYDYEPEVILNLCEDGSSDNRSGQTTPVLSKSMKNAVPESPPPPYRTPPSTTSRQSDFSLDFNLPGPSKSSIGTLKQIIEKNSETIETGTCSTLLSLDIPEHRDTEPRRGWQRNSDSSFRSLPASRRTSKSPSSSRSTSPSSTSDAEHALGAYACRCGTHIVPSSCTPNPSRAPSPPNFRVPQSGSSSAASGSTRVECVGGCAIALGEDVIMELQKLEADRNEPESRMGAVIVLCPCESARGCASSKVPIPGTSVTEEPGLGKCRTVHFSQDSRSLATNLVLETAIDANCDHRDIGRKLLTHPQNSPLASLSTTGFIQDLRNESSTAVIPTNIIDSSTLTKTPANLMIEPAKLIVTPTRPNFKFNLCSLSQNIKRLELFLAQREKDLTLVSKVQKNSPSKTRLNRVMTCAIFKSLDDQMPSRSETRLLRPNLDRRRSED